MIFVWKMVESAFWLLSVCFVNMRLNCLISLIWWKNFKITFSSISLIWWKYFRFTFWCFVWLVYLMVYCLIYFCLTVFVWKICLQTVLITQYLFERKIHQCLPCLCWIIWMCYPVLEGLNNNVCECVSV